MSDHDNIAAARLSRPAAPGPTLEEQLQKAVADGRGGNAQRAVGMMAPGTHGHKLDRASIGGVYGGVSPVPATPMTNAAYIASRLGRVLDRLRDTEARCESIAVTLAGPGMAASIAGPGMAASIGSRNAIDQPPAASLFVIYERTLDEIDRIIDNIENEQARTRNILGD